MGKAFGLVLILVSIWIGLEIYSEGSARAFGGLLVRAGLVAEPAPGETPARTGERAAARLREVHREQVDRVERQLLE